MLETDGVRLRGALGRPDPSELLYPSSQGQNAPHGWNGCEPPARAALKRRSGRGGDQYLHRPGRSSTPLIRAPDWSATPRAHPIGRTVRSGPGLGHARVDARPRAGRGRGRGCTRPRKQNVRPTIEPGCAVLILEYSLQPDICKYVRPCCMTPCHTGGREIRLARGSRDGLYDLRRACRLT